ncbi:MAG: DMT family transporter [Desulfitobacteriaceae bacterium]|nr:DMT family transporter [Desulfitobacteriaceae bacterium]MDD4345750.1 DMT family transporter [Desulfitobacteriaceae bacterium]MDD4400955.1 DMT family transporter [Desulfitobacteriaceae bacterium]
MTKISTLPFLIAAFSGICMAVQGSLNSLLAQKTSLMATTFIVHLLGSLLAVIVIIFGKIPVLSYNWFSIPWHLYLGSLLSIIIISLVALSIPKIGVSNATTAIIIGQVGAAVLIDHFGLLGIERIPWSYWQFLGLAFFAIGAKLLFR